MQCKAPFQEKKRWGRVWYNISVDLLLTTDLSFWWIISSCNNTLWREHFKVKLARRLALKAANSCAILIFSRHRNIILSNRGLGLLRRIILLEKLIPSPKSSLIYTSSLINYFNILCQNNVSNQVLGQCGLICEHNFCMHSNQNKCTVYKQAFKFVQTVHTCKQTLP